MSAGERLIETWRPSPRPDWVQRVNDEGSHLDLTAVVPLDAEHLVAAAMKVTGLQDFGPDDWREPFQVLTKALDAEADLNLYGRILASTELLGWLKVRLNIEAYYKRHPEIDDEVISRPIFILGQPRTGSSALQNLLAADPHSCVIHTWQLWHPTPNDENDPQDVAKRIASADQLATMWNRAAPELINMHEINALVPTECNAAHNIAFRSRTLPSYFAQVPSYGAYMATAPMQPAFAYHRRILKLLQWRKHKPRWILKSPDYIMMIPEILAQYPDARLVYTHRDPVKAFGSGVSFIGALYWMRSDHPFKYENPNNHATSLKYIATLLDKIIDALEGGDIPREQFYNVRYIDFVKSPLEVAKQIYAYFGEPLEPYALAAMQCYVEANANRRATLKHAYEKMSPDETAAARQAFRRYSRYFNVPEEA